MIKIFTLVVTLLCLSLTAYSKEKHPYVFILGTAQDAGYPQAGCYKSHCLPGWADKDKRRTAISIAYVDQTQKSYIFDASPDFPEHMYRLHQQPFSPSLSGIFITHAHIGHYTGLMYLGHEAMGALKMPVFVMPKMKQYIETNGPWSQLVEKRNITLFELSNEKTYRLSKTLAVTPLLVPHRDEYSETVGFHIQGPRKSALFIPDINKWHLWRKDIREEIKKVDYALIDATFFSGDELPGRDMSKIPHPSVKESMTLFQSLSNKDKNRIWFIHMNHTNPLLNAESSESKQVIKAGYNIAREGIKLPM
ncbi:MBL fold metallo-hydrolase [Temperatibacter marinus]|uniref:MBL fold metallo-hydrolase n=1 Tax=Temperatibacter marinus TaxID=1456591 RepID=A0AA52EBT6_9PROT|nr:MBL fold metallo-hydrolase [Temperatibacter marinus]WND01921.1 MBL fold metallo-hydrolase [Temperatibacter marinus]